MKIENIEKKNRVTKNIRTLNLIEIEKIKKNIKKNTKKTNIENIVMLVVNQAVCIE